MKRRQVITAFGTLAVATGTALGTGAFSATSSSSQASMNVVTQGDANLDVVPGSGVSGGNDDMQTGLLSQSEINELGYDDLPLAVVEDVGQGMVNVQVFVEVGSTTDFSELLQINNNDEGAYNVGFEFTGFGPAVDDGPINSSSVPDIFTFYKGDNPSGEISGLDLESGGTPDTGKMVEVGSGGDSQVTLGYDGTVTDLTNAYNSAAGNFSGDTTKDSIADSDDFPSNDDSETKTEELVQEVTAVASAVE
jgi:hypothetical protein